MKKSKFLAYAITIFITFITVLSSSNPVNAYGVAEAIKKNVAQQQVGNIGGVQYTKEQLQKLQTNNSFEMATSGMCLAVGDFVMEYLTFLLKEEVTVQKIIYNRVDALNANFFAKSENPSPAPASKLITEAVNAWYDLLGKIVIITYLMALIVIGIMTMLGRNWTKSQGSRFTSKVDDRNSDILFISICNEICI